jgi:hypothetical protein
MSSLSAGRLSPGSSSLPGTTLLHLVKARVNILLEFFSRAFPRTYPFSLFPAFQEFSCFIFSQKFPSHIFFINSISVAIFFNMNDHNHYFLRSSSSPPAYSLRLFPLNSFRSRDVRLRILISKEFSCRIFLLVPLYEIIKGTWQ